ncbi:class IV adenylate cyclase [Halorubrum lacusprofundi]|jgi:adenylate cyclase class 2|uniref:Adenylyl cyclase CyaB n=1 Tax=Halorubrum lacusprofundi (strain ATCC 49239 / DSM 5036 / JCM 8891 / ACAM 34) TaxID=416348 RepID=B9LUS7_HALLT|nr:class IV adenylate cyclase [Halorubrum lacusprofundi]ACM56404.1 adenylyl cyclase CyaB [Halorubrum lacusprofundi ATCC 49239]MCG1005323.1 class IV adenylate cyclase [Halorubrum lacusprofundi]
MYEVEIKVSADTDAVRKRLRAAGAERVDARRQRDAYYDAPHRDFAETDEALRVRRETPLPDGIGAETEAVSTADPTAETTKLTYKGPRLDGRSKTRVEHETAVDDGEAMAGVLSGLGFEPAAVVEKRREFWSFAGFTVTLDAVDGVGEFVEIEREVDDESAIEATRDEALEALDRLGLDGDSQIRTSYLGLMLADGEEAD